MLEVEVLRLAGVSIQVVELAWRAGRGVGEEERFELGILLVAVAAGTGVIEIFPLATADGESARPSKSLLKQVRPDGTAVLAKQRGKQVEAGRASCVKRAAVMSAVGMRFRVFMFWLSVTLFLLLVFMLLINSF